MRYDAEPNATSVNNLAPKNVMIPDSIAAPEYEQDLAKLDTPVDDAALENDITSPTALAMNFDEKIDLPARGPLQGEDACSPASPLPIFLRPSATWSSRRMCAASA